MAFEIASHVVLGITGVLLFPAWLVWLGIALGRAEGQELTEALYPTATTSYGSGGSTALIYAARAY